MPSDVGTAYGAWLVAHQEKAGRLATVVGQVLPDFRTGLSANPHVRLNEDPSLARSKKFTAIPSVAGYNVTRFHQLDKQKGQL